MRKKGVVDAKTSPGCLRIVALLRESPSPMSIVEIVEQAHVAEVYGGHLIRLLLEAKRVHVADWRRRESGHLDALYRAGDGVGKPRPRRLSQAEKCHRYRQRVKDSFPREVANRVLAALHGSATVTTVVADGKVVYRKGQGVLFPSFHKRTGGCDEHV